ncbi:NlpC/P60 family protein [Pseudomonas sp. RIT-PI-AD]|uniref:NlpC/P60 family protein n=1 Tax=Pseudomonas sp. RIT-PI-AD TaxID=3035294 RepID=UPI0021DB3C7F|nr:NlpC/P60 family protein [Pseudomonas sp. RIT-PI-AD]
MAEDKAQKIIALCEKHWAAHKRDCSGFVKRVADELGIPLSGQANAMVDQIQRAPWKRLASGREAKDHAANGELVIAGLKANPNGHVVIVVDGPLSQGKYPTAYWGSLGGVGKKNTTLNWSWNATDRDRVIYASWAWQQ